MVSGASAVALIVYAVLVGSVSTSISITPGQKSALSPSLAGGASLIVNVTETSLGTPLALSTIISLVSPSVGVPPIQTTTASSPFFVPLIVTVAFAFLPSGSFTTRMLHDGPVSSIATFTGQSCFSALGSVIETGYVFNKGSSTVNSLVLNSVAVAALNSDSVLPGMVTFHPVFSGIIVQSIFASTSSATIACVLHVVSQTHTFFGSSSFTTGTITGAITGTITGVPSHIAFT